MFGMRFLIKVELFYRIYVLSIKFFLTCSIYQSIRFDQLRSNKVHIKTNYYNYFPFLFPISSFPFSGKPRKGKEEMRTSKGKDFVVVTVFPCQIMQLQKLKFAFGAGVSSYLIITKRCLFLLNYILMLHYNPILIAFLLFKNILIFLSIFFYLYF